MVKTEGDLALNHDRKQLVETIFKAVRNESIVKDGKLPTERVLAEMFSTTRAAVREAIIVLEAYGILEVRDRQGIFVVDQGLRDLNRSLDLYSSWPADLIPRVFQMRLILETPAAGLAARFRTDRDLDRMKQCIDRFRTLYEEHPVNISEQAVEWNDLIHRIFVEATQNDVLVRVYEGMVGVLRKAESALHGVKLATPYELWPELIIEGHQKIIDAIEARDEKLAQELMKTHLQISAENLKHLYEYPEMEILLKYPQGDVTVPEIFR
jgi:GntR family transcriptional repressor for pyruvate dehydrogenase complex